MSRFACVLVEAFAAAALVRAEPGLADRPLAVVAGTPPATRVVEASAAARECGVRPGLADAEAGARCPDLVRRPVCAEAIASARAALLDACLGVSPRVEDAGPGLVHVDITGLGRLVGDDEAIAARLVRAARAVGLPARVGVAESRTAARVAARLGARATIVPPGADRRALAGVPVAECALDADLVATLARWGVTTLGEFAALPRAGLAARLGAAGLAAHDLACGRDREPFRAYEPPPFWEEAEGLEWEIEALDPLAAVLERVLGRLCTRLTAAHRAADGLDVRLALASGGHHARALPLACPMEDVRPMLTLVRLDLERHPPAAPVVAVAVSARAVTPRAAAGHLWRPPSPATRDLATVLARLAALVGGDNVGAIALADSHRPDALAPAPFAPPADVGGEDAARPHAGTLVLRRLRPPRVVEVETDGEGRPVAVRGALCARAVVVGLAGPWRLSGEWWDGGAWGRDEWDVALGDGGLCRLARDAASGAWRLEGVYD